LKEWKDIDWNHYWLDSKLVNNIDFIDDFHWVWERIQFDIILRYEKEERLKELNNKLKFILKELHSRLKWFSWDKFLKLVWVDLKFLDKIDL